MTMVNERPIGGWPCPAIPTPLWKRTIDIAVALPLLLLASPLMLIIAIGTKLTMGGPVLFRQARGGHGGSVFHLLKFRTMLDLTDEHGELLPDAQRRHPWGGFLRRFSLDELPSLVHVVLGQMSLVGPRPFLATYLDRYSEVQAQRHAVVPGITGLAQTRGRNFVQWDEKFEMDLGYVHNRSFALDLQIIVDTFKVVISGSGADGAVHATEFMGDEALADVPVHEVPAPPVMPVREEPAEVYVPEQTYLPEPGLLSDAVTTLELAARTTLDLRPTALPRYEAS